MHRVPREDFLEQQVGQVRAQGAVSVRRAVEGRGQASNRGRGLGRAWALSDKMLTAPRCTIFLPLAGAMIPAGMRAMIVDMIERRLLDAIVSTGANVIHDIVECLG